ncbi:MAG: class I SAM-dependent methyltransferase [Deltaproteobacteria bacterium]|nr:class I SAM-dependent methyltransferase [Deltaproteobacteria bacterium]
MTTQGTAMRLGGGEMFDRIAARYDLLNRLLSMGLDLRWRRMLLDALGPLGDGEFLDVATGTADVALALARRGDEVRVVGLDPSSGMLGVGRRKVGDAGLAGRIELVQGDAQAMPFADDRFAGATMAFGIRNVPDRVRGLREMARVVRPGGVVAVLELGEPRRGLLAPFARLHVHHIVPRLGALISGAREYRYLQESIAAFPAPETFCEKMREAGLVDVDFTPMFPEVAHLYVGRVAGR